MNIQWTQKAWCNVKANGQTVRRCWAWQGQRSDGRTFRITHIPHLAKPYVCSSFNGTQVGAGKSLAEAQKCAEDVPAVSLPHKTVLAFCQPGGGPGGVMWEEAA